MTAMRWTVVIVLFSLVSVSACREKHRTALVVEVDSNLAVPGELDKVDVAVTANGNTQHMPYSLVNGSTLPLRTALVEVADTTGSIDIVATGSLNGNPVVHTEAVVGFVEKDSRLLKLFLAAECRGDPCAAFPTKTCTAGGTCAEKAQPPTALAPFDPQKPAQHVDAAVVPAKDSGISDGPISTDGSQGKTGDAGRDTQVIGDAAPALKLDTSPAIPSDSAPALRLDTNPTIPSDSGNPNPEIADSAIGEVLADRRSDASSDTWQSSQDAPAPLPDVAADLRKIFQDSAQLPSDVPVTADVYVPPDAPPPPPDLSADLMVQQRSLGVAKNGSGDGTVRSSPGGIDCGTSCSANFATGTIVTLTAVPGSSSTFTGWAGACSGTGDCTVAMSATRSVTATFAVAEYTLTVGLTGFGKGSVSSTPAGIACGSTCSAPFTSGTSVTLTATARSTSIFSGWSGACGGTGECAVIMAAATSVGANFDPCTFSQVTAGNQHSCGLKMDGTVACWGTNLYGPMTPPSATFIQIGAGQSHTCGVRNDGTLVCWGSNSWGENTPPSGTFTQVSDGGGAAEHSCAIRTDHTVACWGKDTYGQATPPTGTFSQVGAGQSHTCGVMLDGKAVCWGANDVGQTTAPSGNFIQVSSGAGSSCGLRVDGSVICWGYNLRGEGTPPSATFTQITKAGFFSCGIKNDGTVACWGDNTLGRSTPLPGTFVQISSGQSHTCGVRTDGTAACWGVNGEGESTPY